MSRLYVSQVTLSLDLTRAQAPVEQTHELIEGSVTLAVTVTPGIVRVGVRVRVRVDRGVHYTRRNCLARYV
jgi:hypothetical protein